MRLKPLALACSAAFALAACSGGGANTNAPAVNANATAANANAARPPAEMVRVGAPEVVEARRGAGAGGEVRLSVAEGFHVNANPATEKYLIPTELKFEPAEGFEIGPVAYPESVTRQFAFADKPLAVYEGEVRVGFTLKARPGARPGEHTLRARLRYQACDDEKCYPPRTADADVRVRVN